MYYTFVKIQLFYKDTILHYELYVHAQLFNSVLLFVSPWTRAPQAPLSMEFSRQKYWSGLPLPTPVGLNLRLLHFLFHQYNFIIKQ